MSGMKKMPGRFTIQFNMEDPQQRAAAGILEQQGRRKAQFLARAILQYTQSGGAPAPGGVDMDTVKQMMLELLNSDPDFSSVVGKVQDVAEYSPSAETEDDSDSERTMTDISKTLAAFQKS